MSDKTVPQLTSRDFPNFAATLAILAEHPGVAGCDTLMGAVSALQDQFTALWEATEAACQ